MNIADMELSEKKHLRRIKDDKLMVNIFLSNGIRLRGQIVDFSNRMIIVKSDKLGRAQIVYIINIASIDFPINLFDLEVMENKQL